MRILVAEDEIVSRRKLQLLLARWGYDVVAVEDGEAAWAELQLADAPRLAVLDWMMPHMDGVQVTRLLRGLSGRDHTYVILLSAREQSDDVAEGLDAGADDYITKPFAGAELRARLRVGERLIALESALNAKISELEAASRTIYQLESMIPICMHCGKMRGEQQVWMKADEYFRERGTDMSFSHALCDSCLAELYPEEDTDEVPEDT